MIKIPKLLLPIFCIAIVIFTAHSANATTLKRGVVGFGGGKFTAGQHTLYCSIGQPVISGYNNNLASGFWAGLKNRSQTQQVLDLIALTNGSVLCEGKPFEITLRVAATENQPVEGVQVYIKFDPDVLGVENIISGTALDFVLQKDINNGYINYAAASFIRPPQNSDFDLMTISFKPKQKNVETTLEIDSNNSNIKSQGQYSTLKADDIKLNIGECVKCRVNLQGREAKPHASWITNLAIHTDVVKTITTDSMGYCYLPDTVSPGENSFCVKSKSSLSNKIGPPIGTGVINLGTLLEGDVNNDNKIDFDDFMAMDQSKGKCQGDTGYNKNADVNVDNCVNDTDIEIAFGDGENGNGNFGKPAECALDTRTGTLRRGLRSQPPSATLTTSQIPADLTVGQSFDMTVQLDAFFQTQVTEGITTYLNFDPDSLRVNALTAGQHFNFVLQKSFDNDSGEINFAATSSSKAYPTGSFPIVTINLTLLKENGAETLTFNTTGVRKTQAVADGRPITPPEYVGAVIIENPPIVANFEGLPDPNMEDDTIVNPNFEGLPDPDMEDETMLNPNLEGLPDPSDNGGVIEPEWPGDDDSESDPEPTVTYQASGTLTDPQGQPMTGVTVQIGDKTVVTDETGHWQIDGLEENQYTAIASKDGYHFKPIDFVASHNTPEVKVQVPAPTSALDITLEQIPTLLLQGDSLLTYAAEIKNQGQWPATGVSFTQQIPANASFFKAETEGGSCAFDGQQTVHCQLNDLPSDKSWVVHVHVTPQGNQKLVSTATVNANEYPPNQDMRITHIRSFFSASGWVVPRPVMVNGNAIYKVLIRNNEYSPATAEGTVVKITLPPEVVFLSADTDDGNCERTSAANVVCQLNPIAPDSAAGISFTTQPIRAGTFYYQLEVTNPQFEPIQARDKVVVISENSSGEADLIFLIDTTGSMDNDIQTVIQALTQILSDIETEGKQAPTVAIIPFKDEVEEAQIIVTDDLRQAIEQLQVIETGGGNEIHYCPEASVQAMAKALEIVNQEGRVILVTDASPHPDTDADEPRAAMETKDVQLDVFLSGDCVTHELEGSLTSRRRTRKELECDLSGNEQVISAAKVYQCVAQATGGQLVDTQRIKEGSPEIQAAYAKVMSDLLDQVVDKLNSQGPKKPEEEGEPTETTNSTPPPIPGYYWLFVGSPNGHVISEPVGIDCDRGEGQCFAAFKHGTKLKLTPVAPEGVYFDHWGGDIDCEDGKIWMLGMKQCMAYFYGIPTQQ